MDTLQGRMTNLNVLQDTYILTWMDAFLVDRKASGAAKGTIMFYTQKFKEFMIFCDSQAIRLITEITPDVIRQYFLWLEKNHHKPGGIHCSYRTLHAFLTWWENELELDGWKNPINKVKAPRVPIEPIEPVSLEDVKRLLNVCKRGDFIGDRDRAIILVLLDTGCRASELVSMDLADFDTVSGSILIRRGKGGKPRTVFLGRHARKAIRTYLKHRHDDHPFLWLNKQQERLRFGGLSSVIQYRSDQAGIHEPGLHDFRRAFAINMLRAGVDVFSLQRLMGHADLQVLRRYLAQSDVDLRAAHDLGSPVEKMLG